MNLLAPFLAFRGRITRRTFWAGLLILAAISPFSITALLSSDPFTEAVYKIRELGFAGLLWSAVLIYCLAALLTKRLHDRNKTGLYAVLFYAPAFLTLLHYFTGFAPSTDWLQTIQSWGWLVGLEMGAVGLWFMIELGTFGPVDPNKYGPNPRDD